jgi:hypothetical protein
LHGPFIHKEKYTQNDFIKLFKYAANSLNHNYNFLTKFKDFDEIFNLYKQIKICLFHFYDMIILYLFLLKLFILPLSLLILISCINTKLNIYTVN